MGSSAATEDSKAKDKDDNLGSAVKRSRDEVAVLHKERWTVLAQIELCEEADSEIGKNGGVDADEEPALFKSVGSNEEGRGRQHTHVPENDVEVNVIEELNLGVSVYKPEWNRHDESNEVGDGDPLIPSSDAEHIICYTPCYGESIVLLHILPRPDVRAFDRGQDLKLVRDNSLHHDIVEDCANDRASHLGCECRLRGEMH